MGYSLWGATTSLFSMLFSIVAIYKESWFRTAFISVEISYAVNTTIMWVFWIILWPMIMKMLDGAIEAAKPADKDKVKATMEFMRWYQALLHLIPWVSTVINLAITDMALCKDHWWIAVVTMCPFYSIFNLWG